MSEDSSRRDTGPGDGSNVLCACPAIGGSKQKYCRELLTREGTPGSILGVTIASSPGERLAEWSGVIDPITTSLSFIDVSHGGRSAAKSTDGFGGQGGAIVDIIDIDSLDLQDLGAEITAQLSNKSNDPVVVCVDSLTDILQFESEQTVHRFLQVLTARITEAGAIAHYHIDTGGHPEQVIDTLAPIFDRTVRADVDFE